MIKVIDKKCNYIIKMDREYYNTTKKMCDYIEEINYDYIKLKNSREYKIGCFISNFFTNIKKIKFKQILHDCNLLVKSMRLKKYNLKKERFKDVVLNNDYSESEKIAVYTVVFGDYDCIKEPLWKNPNCDYYIITDQEIRKNSIWNKIEVQQDILDSIATMSNSEKNRFFKMNIANYFSQYKYTIYIDGNIEIIGDVHQFIKYINSSTGLAIFNHPSRGCIYDEAEACRILKKANYLKIKKQINRYKEEGMPRGYGMFECNVLVSKNCQRKKNIMSEWWNEYKNSESKRDQVSFPYILWKMGYSVLDVGCIGENMNLSPVFRRYYHK